MRPPGELLGRGWRRLLRFECTRRAAVVLVAIGLLEYALVAAFVPLAAGRDLGTYLRAAYELRSSEVVLPQAMLGRAPITGVVAEGLLTLGPIAAECGMALAYALSLLCWWRVARRVGATVGIAVAAVLLAYPGYALLFHQLASDALFAAAFALAALLAARFVDTPSYARGAAAGLGVALLVLVRPVSQVLLVFVLLVPLLRGEWRQRSLRLAVVGAAALFPLAGWAAHNVVRADDFTIVRGGGHAVPLYRAFVIEGIVDPGNGDATRRLARVVERDLLPREPYRGYGIGLDEFFASRSARMHEDLAGVADRTWGWDDDYAHLAQVGREAVLAHPTVFARGVARDLWRLLWWPLFVPIDADEESPPGQPAVAPGDGLPQPSEGQPIPSASVSGFISTPDGRFSEVWTSPTEHGIVARDPRDARRLHLNNVRVDELSRVFSERAPNERIASLLNGASRWFPRPVVWLVVGLALVALRRPRPVATPLLVTGAALAIVAGTALAVPPTAAYTVPVAPAFVLLAATGMLASRSRRRPRTHGP